MIERNLNGEHQLTCMCSLTCEDTLVLQTYPTVDYEGSVVRKIKVEIRGEHGEASIFLTKKQSHELLAKLKVILMEEMR